MPALPRLPVAGCALALALFAPAPTSAQGWIEPLLGRPIPLGSWAVEKTRSEARVTVEGRVARVELTEWFKNEGDQVAEGEYLYPLSGEAAFAGFSLWQGEDELRGEVMDRERARDIYEEIVRRRADPALIELAGHGLLRARVFPIDPGQERRVQLRYTQLLATSGDALHFRYAGGVRGGEPDRPAPRPLRGPAPRRSERDQKRLRERSADAERARTDFEMVVEEGDGFLDPFSPTHALQRERRGGRLIVRLVDELAGELSVFLPRARPGVGLTVASHRPVGEPGYLMLTLTPGLMDEAPPEPRDVTVVVDVSGSMAGEKVRQARDAIHALLETFDAGDRFRLVAFSNSVRAQSEGWRSAEDAELREAAGWVDRLEADGGTNLEVALAEAFRVAPGEGRLPVVIFLTDGLPTVGERDPERIAADAERARGRARVFAFGVGHDVNTHLLDRISAVTRGSTDYVQPGESVERALSLLAAKIRHPVLTDLELAAAPARLREVYPVDLPDVFAGQDLVLLARYEAEGEGEVAITGRRLGRTERFSTRARLPDRSEANAYLPRLWASRKLGHLTRQLWLEGPTPSLVEEIRQTALRYGLPSEYTAYLVEEPGVVALDRGRGGGGGRGGALGFGVAAPGAPAQAQGAGAVASAARARLLRQASRAADVDVVARELEARANEVEGTRMAAGRLFQERDWVWTEHSPTADRLPVITVELFSRAWFQLLDALPELVPAARELGRMEFAGARIRLRFDDAGLEELTPERMERVVMDFRGAE